MKNLCKILIVDDECILRRGIKYLCEWEKEGFEFVGECSNANEALDLIEKTKPNIVITDIVMPNTNGISLTKIINKKYPNISVVVLSGHSNFEFVKDAFKSGAIDYILKPGLIAKDFISLLKDISAKNNHLAEYPLTKKCFKNSLCSLLSGYKNDIDSLKYHFKESNFILVGIDSNNNEINSENELNLICKNLKISKYQVFQSDENVLLLLINFNKNMSNITIDLNTHIYNYISKNKYSYFAISNSFNNILELENHYIKIKKLLSLSFFITNKNIFTQNYLKQSLIKIPFDYNSLNTYIHNTDFPSICSLIINYICQVALNISLDEYILKKQVSNFLYVIMTSLENMGLDCEDIKYECLKFFKNIDNSKNYQELINQIKDIFENISLMVDLKSINKDKFILDKIYNYVEENYNQQILLSDIAEKLYLNYSYLSTYFNNHSTENFSEYLNRVRIEKSKIFLKDHSISIYEVSYLVGYSEQSYFSKIFKSYTGLTPSKFRRINS